MLRLLPGFLRRFPADAHAHGWQALFAADAAATLGVASLGLAGVRLFQVPRPFAPDRNLEASTRRARSAAQCSLDAMPRSLTRSVFPGPGCA